MQSSALPLVTQRFTNTATRVLPNTYLLPAWRQTRIPTNLANKIIFTLTMSAKVDGTRLDMNVH